MDVSEHRAASIIVEFDDARAEKLKKIKLLQYRFSLRRIPLNVRAISAKNIYQKTTHSTVTFQMLFETSHSSSLAQVTPR